MLQLRIYGVVLCLAPPCPLFFVVCVRNFFIYLCL